MTATQKLDLDTTGNLTARKYALNFSYIYLYINWDISGPVISVGIVNFPYSNMIYNSDFISTVYSCEANLNSHEYLCVQVAV